MLISTAYAQAAGGAPSNDFIVSLMPLVLIFAVFYFLMIRPQQKRMKAHQAMVAGAQIRDTVITNGGLVGKVTKVDEHELEIEIAQGVKVRVIKSMLADIRPYGSKAAND